MVKKRESLGIGSLVFARLKGYPPWPAKIVQAEKKKYHGTGEKSPAMKPEERIQQTQGPIWLATENQENSIAEAESNANETAPSGIDDEKVFVPLIEKPAKNLYQKHHLVLSQNLYPKDDKSEVKTSEPGIVSRSGRKIKTKRYLIDKLEETVTPVLKIQFRKRNQLKKLPGVVQTMKRLQRYVGKANKWEMDNSMKADLDDKAQKIRLEAEEIYSSFSIVHRNYFGMTLVNRSIIFRIKLKIDTRSS
uniref:CSON005569 protein n=1 Tax=Culicoides sonorensis TaxID=179676 RepID=A0A336LY06_CULSO